VPLHKYLRQDKDSIQCFLSTFTDAKQAQDIVKEKMAAAARTFFCPKHKSSFVPLRTCTPLGSTSKESQLALGTIGTITSEATQDSISLLSCDTTSCGSVVSLGGSNIDQCKLHNL